jgi:hypothetical protein
MLLLPYDKLIHVQLKSERNTTILSIQCHYVPTLETPTYYTMYSTVEFRER